MEELKEMASRGYDWRLLTLFRSVACPLVLIYPCSTVAENATLQSQRDRVLAQAVLELEASATLAADVRLTAWPPYVGHFSGLKALFLEGHDLDSIDASLGGLVRLETLHLARNKIRYLPLEAFIIVSPLIGACCLSCC